MGTKVSRAVPAPATRRDAFGDVRDDDGRANTAAQEPPRVHAAGISGAALAEVDRATRGNTSSEIGRWDRPKQIASRR
jgi:hypothetical protein